MRKKWLIFVAAMTALSITACGSGDGIVINGTTAAEAESDQPEEEGSVAANETTSRTKIEIVTGDTTAAVPTEESAAQSTEEWTQAATEPSTTAVPQTASTTRAAAETTAAKKYNVSDVKKTMYATASVRVRSSYSTSSDVLAALADGEKVSVTGQVENGWMRVSYKGQVGYVSGSYLTETPPATKSTTSVSAGQTSSQTKPSTNTQTKPSTNTQTKPSTTTGNGTTPGETGGPAGPTSGNNAAGTTNPGGTAGPTAGTGSGGTSGPSAGTSSGGTSGPSAGTGTGTAKPGSSTNQGGGASTGGSSVSGTVTSLNPSGVTVQAGNGSSYQFVWGTNAPDLVEGEQVQITYVTTSSGEKQITGVSK